MTPLNLIVVALCIESFGAGLVSGTRAVWPGAGFMAAGFALVVGAAVWQRRKKP